MPHSSCYDKAQELLEKHPLKIRIGLNSGPMIQGNIGGTGKLEFTVIGDTVNSASRMEGMNRYLGTSIIASGDCWHLSNKNYPMFRLGRFVMKGKAEPVDLYGYAPLDDTQIGCATSILESYEAMDRNVFRSALKQYQHIDQPLKLVEFYIKRVKTQRPEDFGKPIVLGRK